jgi:Spy/CpxP family protein refolding chaperone
MKHFVLTAIAGFLVCVTAYADDTAPTPPPEPAPASATTAPVPAPAPAEAPPATHVDTTVVGSGVSDKPGESAAPDLENNHGFVAGEPELLSVTQRLKLSPKQRAQLRDVIENADAGAAVLIEREHDVRQMIAATTPEDPMYAKLIKDQNAGAADWTQNRENLRRAVLDILTPAQQKRFEELQAGQTQPAPQ